MKYRRLNITWGRDFFPFEEDDRGWCDPGGAWTWLLNVVVVPGGFHWAIRRNVPGEPTRMPTIESVTPERTRMAARLAAIKALRKHLGMLPEREGWKPIRRRFVRCGYVYRAKDRNATVFPGGDWYVFWHSEIGPPIVTGTASTMEAAAEAAERALGVKP